ncbi:AAA family ATPase [Rhizobium deserti]|nr:AAA family ATPase [Rhizobium deserti]
MTKLRPKFLQETPHLASLVAQYGIRSAIRTLIDRPLVSFIALLRIEHPADAFLYQEAARVLLEVGETYDGEGQDIAAVWLADDLDRGSWSLVPKVKHVKRAIILAGRDAIPTEDVRLLVDLEAAVAAPRAVHFRMAARQLRLAPISEEEASQLAAWPLRSVRLAMGRGRPIARVIGSLAKPAVKPASERVADTKRGPSLETLSGYGAAKEWGLMLARDLADWKAGRIGWDDVDRGVLLSGPPGSGKTTYAAALAVTCGVPLISASAAQWQASGHLGDLLKAMRKFFTEARSRAPCIAFLDEFDSFGDRAAQTDGDHYDYKRQVINGLLECLDPSGGREGVVVVGATNNALAVDAALLRPGRLEKVIEITLPDMEARSDILRHHLGAFAGKLELEPLMAGTEGWSGAELAKLARDARRICRHREGKTVSAADIQAAMPKQIGLTEEQWFRVAVHEAGHVLTGILLDPDNFVRVRLNANTHENRDGSQLGVTEFKRAFPLLAVERDYLNRIAVLLGGMVAERLVFGDHTSGAGGHESSDLAAATGLATMMERNFAFGSSLLTEGSIDPGAIQRFRMYDHELSGAVQRRLEEGLLEAKRLLSDKQDALEAVARALASERDLDAARVKRLLPETWAAGSDRLSFARAANETPPI